MFALTIAPSAMNGSAASGLLAQAREAAGELDVLGRRAEHDRGERRICAASPSAAPLTAPRPVTANWLA